MRRILIGLGILVATLVAVAAVVPLFLPKDTIKQQVIKQVESAAGWRLRLDGDVSLSLVPSFSLIADNIGLSGEAGADGIEFAKAQRIEFGLAWAGLFGGEIRVTEITLVEPNIFLEIATTGTTSWAPRRDLSPAEEAAEILSGEVVGSDPASSVETVADSAPANASDSFGYLERIGIDELTIVSGQLVYDDKTSDLRQEISDLDLTLSAPDVREDITLDSSFLWQGRPSGVSGKITDLIALLRGESAPVDITLTLEDASIGVAGQVGLEPLKLDVAVTGTGPSVAALAAVAETELAVDPGAFSVFGQVNGDETAVSVSNLSLSVGDVGVDGQMAASLTGDAPNLNGQLVLRDSSLENLLKLAGQSLPAKGTLSGNMTFAAVGKTADEIVSSLKLQGRAAIRDGEISELGLADAVGGDASADVISGIAMEAEINGLDQKATLRGGLSWRGEAFTVSGSAVPAPLIDGKAAPVAIKVKGNRVTAGFDGTASAARGVDGAVTVETANLRQLLAWLGQPVEAGSGLKNFSASGIFAASETAVSFEETRFTLDQTSGSADGSILLGDKPTVKANLVLSSLVLDPYLSTGSKASAAASGSSGGSSSGGSSGASGGAPVAPSASGWDSAPIDFAGLNAVNLDVSIKTSEIRWDKLKIDQSALSAKIQDGMLTANLTDLKLYEGSGSGAVTLNGKAETPELTAQFSLGGAQALPLLKDAADFDWIAGTSRISFDVTSRGGSQKALVDALNGAAEFSFADGAIRGINIPKMVRSLSVQTLLGWQDSSNETTDFSSLSASFAIANGIATNSDLSLVGPLVRMSGSGTTNMPAQTLDWRVEPKIVASLSAEEQSDGELAGLGVPIIAKGSWAQPRIYPDITGILQNPQAAYKQLEQLGGGLFSILKDGQGGQGNLAEQATDILNKLTGKKGKQEEANPEADGNANPENGAADNGEIDLQKVIEGDVDDKQILESVEKGLGLPSGLLGNFGIGKKN
ncbi:MAG: AsmA family protein [Rhodobacteraceae bacterium]|nr:AsmA family protein [Paracoccaceae bacterium]